MFLELDLSEKCDDCGDSLSGQYDDPTGVLCDECYDISLNSSGLDDDDDFDLGGES